MATTNHYRVIDSHTGATVGIYRTRARARRTADRLDLIYGAIRYRVECVDARG